MPEILTTPYNPLADLYRWLDGNLRGDTLLVAALAKRPGVGDTGAAIYQDAAPEKAIYPLVRFAVLTHRFQLGVGAIRVIANPLVLIEVIGQTRDRCSLEVPANRIDALFGQRRDGSQEGRLIVSGSWCEEPFAPPPELDEGGTEYRRVGGKYRLFCSFAPEA